jgi:hypothetical protein
MDSNRSIDSEDDDELNIDFGTGDDQQNVASLLQQTRQQQHEINQLRFNVQSNAEFIASYLLNNPPATGNRAVDPRSFDFPSEMLVQGALNYSGSSVMPFPPPMNPQLQGALGEAQRRGMSQEIPPRLHLSQIQQAQSGASQQENYASPHSQMFLLNHHQSPHQLVDPIMQGQSSNAVSAATAFMPHEAHALYSSQIASRLLSMGGQPDITSVPFHGTRKLIDPDEELKAAGNRGLIEPFPEKLHRLLTETEKAGQDDIIAFADDGKSFEIRKPARFFKEIVPKYFKQSRLSSFKRQLNLYGFELISSGSARGGYTHESFQKDRPDLCRTIRRRDVKFCSRPNASKIESESNPAGFYSKPPTAPKVNQIDKARPDNETDDEL